jgi:hypothetical protein
MWQIKHLLIVVNDELSVYIYSTYTMGLSFTFTTYLVWSEPELSKNST